MNDRADRLDDKIPDPRRVEAWNAIKPERSRRRARADCRPMPYLLTLADVTAIHPWPIGNVKLGEARGQGWTDAVVFFDDAIRVGGLYPSRRVRYDGRLYITYARLDGGKAYFDGAVTAWALDVVTHLYGLDAESDALHNVLLKGY